jgi:hypothetical protein
MVSVLVRFQDRGKMIIYLDFDGTITGHSYPAAGRCNHGCFEVIKKIQAAGHKVILNTKRVEKNRQSFDAAIEFLNNADKIQPIQEYTEKKLQPGRWDLKKAVEVGVIFIDDHCLNIPLKMTTRQPGRLVDWSEINYELENAGII